MNIKVQDFCDYISSDAKGFVLYLERETKRNMSISEKAELEASYRAVSTLLTKTVKKNPRIAYVDLTTTDMLLEYKIPGAPSWCDLVLLGKGHEKNQVIIVELKNYRASSKDNPGEYEGLINHNGDERLHPADQVKGYTEYCRGFHSTVVESGANVDGCVYFTSKINLEPYKAAPNDKLTSNYPVFNTEVEDELSDYISSRIEEPDEIFAAQFVNGFYKQDRNILKQVAESLKKKGDMFAASARPFVLIDKQKEGYLLASKVLRDVLKTDGKHVIIVQGPPGSGKSAVAVNLWIDAVLKYPAKGNVVYVTTSGCQNDNWVKTFKKNTKVKDVIVTANSFNPGMNGSTMKNHYIPIYERIDMSIPKPEDKYMFKKPTGGYTMRYDKFRDYLKYMQEHNETKNYKENLNAISIVDEAHALINPIANNFRSNKSAGWCVQMGPQAWHIINESQVSIFFTDNKQSFRDNETTTSDDIREWAIELGADITEISLEGMQFRCGGSAEYIEWLEKLFTDTPVKNHHEWEKKFDINIANYPSEAVAFLRAKEKITDSIRLLSSYTVSWVSSGLLDMKHKEAGVPYDFVLKDKGGTTYNAYWNYGEDGCYDVYVQAREGSAMAKDPLCEIGCPYTVRGFDYDYVGIFWLSDLVRRGEKWVINPKKCLETAIEPTRKAAIIEQCKIQGYSTSGVSINKFPSKLKNFEVDLALDPNDSATRKLFDKIVQSYRILMSRGIKGITLYIDDEETRNYVRSML